MCQLNIKCVNSTKIQISGLQLPEFNNPTPLSIPLSMILINVRNFRATPTSIERKPIQINELKRYIFGLQWKQHNQMSTFCIGFKDKAQFKHFNDYMRRLLTKCRTANMGEHFIFL